MIMNFAYVEVFENDGLSKIICLACLDRLNNIYDFKDLIIKSDTQLRNQQDDDEENIYNFTTQDEESNLEFPCQPTTFVKCEGKENNDHNSNQEEHNDQLQNQEDVDCSTDHREQNNLLHEKTNKNQRIKKRNKMFRCDHCQKTFKNRYSLISHEATHTGSFPHSCDICNKGFATNWAMNVHRRYTEKFIKELNLISVKYVAKLLYKLGVCKFINTHTQRKNLLYVNSVENIILLNGH
ncbi:zf-AD domain containing protein, partial [Asbolus verrucosus]